MSEFGVSEKTARQCFNMFTINNTRELDFDYFVSLFEEYYLSDDPSDLGNFINGRLEYPDDDSSDAETHGKDQDTLPRNELLCQLFGGLGTRNEFHIK